VATDPALSLLVAKDALARITSAREAANVIRTHRVPREVVPIELLTHAEVWEALLADMPMTAMIRNLATMTRVGLLAPGSNATKNVVAKLGDNTRLAKARIHPVAVLAALLTYKSGRGAKGSSTWSPIGQIVDALDGAFYATFKTIEPSGKRMLLALDVSGSMSWGTIAGVPGLTPRVGSAAMSLVTAASEKDHTILGFSDKLVPLAISPRQRLDDAVAAIDRIPMGGTDCAQPMIYAQKNKVDVDTFVVYTDNETWAGSVHPAQALRAYRQARGIPAKLVVVGMTSNGFTIADPNDAGMLDVVGFDTATPPVISDFARA
jgi:60 kDa SS-A/Ro ribonucleoprotein